MKFAAYYIQIPISNLKDADIKLFLDIADLSSTYDKDYAAIVYYTYHNRFVFEVYSSESNADINIDAARFNRLIKLYTIDKAMFKEMVKGIVNEFDKETPK